MKERSEGQEPEDLQSRDRKSKGQQTDERRSKQKRTKTRMKAGIKAAGMAAAAGGIAAVTQATKMNKSDDRKSQPQQPDDPKSEDRKSMDQPPKDLKSEQPPTDGSLTAGALAAGAAAGATAAGIAAVKQATKKVHGNDPKSKRKRTENRIKTGLAVAGAAAAGIAAVRVATGSTPEKEPTSEAPPQDPAPENKPTGDDASKEGQQDTQPAAGGVAENEQSKKGQAAIPEPGNEKGKTGPAAGDPPEPEQASATDSTGNKQTDKGQAAAAKPDDKKKESGTTALGEPEQDKPDEQSAKSAKPKKKSSPTKSHPVGPNDDLPSIADKHGINSIRKILDHPGNAKLKKERKDPLCLKEGDVVEIPQNEDNATKASTGKNHKFVYERFPAYFTMQLVDCGMTPLSDNKDLDAQSFTLELKDRFDVPIKNAQGEERIIKGNCIDGEISANIPFEANKAKLTLHMKINGEDQDIVIEVLIGYKDPANTASGKQHRLGTLQCLCGKNDDDFGDFSKDAWSDYKRQELTENTDDAVTEQKLDETHNPTRSSSVLDAKTGGLTYVGPE